MERPGPLARSVCSAQGFGTRIAAGLARAPAVPAVPTQGGCHECPRQRPAKETGSFSAGVKTRGEKMDRNKVRLESRGKSVPREQPEH